MRQKEEVEGRGHRKSKKDPESTGHLRRIPLKLRTEGKLSPRRNWEENAGSLVLQSWTRK